jgi:hypothetical protein
MGATATRPFLHFPLDGALSGTSHNLKTRGTPLLKTNSHKAVFHIECSEATVWGGQYAQYMYDSGTMTVQPRGSPWCHPIRYLTLIKWGGVSEDFEREFSFNRAALQGACLSGVRRLVRLLR